MDPKNRPDAITRAQMPASSLNNPVVPIIIGIVVIIIFFILLFIFIGIIPLEVVKGGEMESQKLETAVNLSETRVMSNLGNTGSLYPNESKIPAKPDPILSKLEQPFAAEEEQEERQMNS